jgi:hypothetical protein
MELVELYCPYHLVVIGNARVPPHTALRLVRERNLWFDTNRLKKKHPNKNRFFVFVAGERDLGASQFRV